jgi:hypothetical protein
LTPEFLTYDDDHDLDSDHGDLEVTPEIGDKRKKNLNRIKK